MIARNVVMLRNLGLRMAESKRDELRALEIG